MSFLMSAFIIIFCFVGLSIVTILGLKSILIYFQIKRLRKSKRPHHKLLNDLTDREKQIAKLLLRGKTYKDISQQLFISEKTVSSHTSKIYEKLGISSKYDLYNLFNNNNSQK